MAKLGAREAKLQFNQTNQLLLLLEPQPWCQGDGLFDRPQQFGVGDAAVAQAVTKKVENAIDIDIHDVNRVRPPGTRVLPDGSDR